MRNDKLPIWSQNDPDQTPTVHHSARVNDPKAIASRLLL
jgi:hypothetical protein